ncbi:hypothetical protein KIN20_018483 [Parelaphostrongylus tenuis]|uniref:Uncharacterized protein n=1 Tax=Parelaphostrongylus tenuis TaxID=148309 RepID=A0AAD5N7K5_PARTN|nr:hypothetical protein KIN20_018483 [Parelaphostrongylus tenuis]
MLSKTAPLFTFMDRREVMTSIKGLHDRIRVLNGRVPEIVNEMTTKKPDVAISELNTNIAVLNLYLVQLKYRMSRLEQVLVDEFTSVTLHRRSPYAASEAAVEGTEEASFAENDVSNLDVTSSDPPFECAILTSDNVELDEANEKSRRARHRSRSLSVVKKVIRRFTRSITPSSRFLIPGDIGADVTLREDI